GCGSSPCCEGAPDSVAELRRGRKPQHAHCCRGFLLRRLRRESAGEKYEGLKSNSGSGSPPMTDIWVICGKGHVRKTSSIRRRTTVGLGHLRVRGRCRRFG